MYYSPHYWMVCLFAKEWEDAERGCERGGLWMARVLVQKIRRTCR